jgi:hypothetical protein
MAGRIDLSRIHGKIQFVDLSADYRVKLVTTFGDLLVQWVDRRPSGPGKWQLVAQFPDFKIKLVDHRPDFTVQYVQAFPGVRR